MNFIFILVLSITSLFAADFEHWVNASQVVDKHEFYKENEVVSVPKDTNQILFAVIFLNTTQELRKDCIIYKVPGEELGILKLKNIRANDNCKDYLFQKGDREWTDLRSLQYSLADNFISISMTQKNYEILRFDIPQIKKFTKLDPKMNISSAEYRAPKIIFNYLDSNVIRLKDGQACQKVKEDCSIEGTSQCESCENGWFEVPNGCNVGPKYCGYLSCGKRNGPACRRGYRYQLQEKKFHCTEDSSFAYCAKGLKVQCQGALAYCI